MQRPEKTLTLADLTLPLTPRATRRLFAYLLRAMLKRASAASLGTYRHKGLAGELADHLVPMVVSGRSCLGLFREICQRFAIDATGSDTAWGPVDAWLPEGRIRWDHVVGAMDYRLLRLVIEESPEFMATFACSAGNERDDAEFDAFPDPVDPGSAFTPSLPKELITPYGYHAVWTLTRPLHHGSDHKSGNVSMFRRQPMCDPLTGKIHHVPFLSGNSIRGQWRDLVMGRWLGLLGLKPEDIQPRKAHALLAGGSIDQGADGATVNNVVRREARDKCPPWDLLAGNTEQQIMSGRLRVGDAVLVCRENAWLVRDAVAPGDNIEEFAQTLPEVATMTHRQQLVRNKHADLEESDNVQALIQQEVIASGNQLLHTVQLFGISGVDPVTASCLADLLEQFRSLGTVGASASRGRGNIAFDGYLPGYGTAELPPPDLYLDTVAKRRDEMIGWAMAPPTTQKSSGKGSRSKATVVEPAQ